MSCPEKDVGSNTLKIIIDFHLGTIWKLLSSFSWLCLFRNWDAWWTCCKNSLLACSCVGRGRVGAGANTSHGRADPFLFQLWLIWNPEALVPFHAVLECNYYICNNYSLNWLPIKEEGFCTSKRVLCRVVPFFLICNCPERALALSLRGFLQGSRKILKRILFLTLFLDVRKCGSSFWNSGECCLQGFSLVIVERIFHINP